MSVDPELRAIVDLVNAVEQATPHETSVEELRSAFASLVAMLGTGAESVETGDVVVPGPAGDLPIRWYRPATSSETGLLPATVWFHGGGWVIGDLDTHDALCRDLVGATGGAVVAVDYRLAPEHRFPAAHDDAVAAVEWLLRHGRDLGIDPERLVLGGDSAGGQLATVTARRLRDRAGAGAMPIRAQILVYPTTDLVGGAAEHPSRAENAEGYLLTAETMDFFTEAYVPEPDLRGTEDASPLRCKDLAGLPPALVLTAEFDPLRDEGAAYARRLEEHGVPTTLHHLDGAVHLCAQMPSTRVGKQVLELIGRFATSHQVPLGSAG